MMTRGGALRSCPSLPFVLLSLAVGPYGCTRAAPAGIARIDGLERLYFERLPAESSAGASSRVPPSLPASLSDPTPSPKGGEGRDIGPVPSRPRDFTLPGVEGVTLREVVDHSQRIPRQFWAVYSGGRRSDVWYFSPEPSRTENKLLGPYELQAIRRVAPGEFVLETCGAMARPQGAWWSHGRDLHFRVEGDRLRFVRVITRFYANRDYDTGGEAAVSMRNESEASDGGVQVRDFDKVPEKLLTECGFPDIVQEADLGCADLEKIVRCVTSRPEAKQTSRRADQPSFVERSSR